VHAHVCMQARFAAHGNLFTAFSRCVLLSSLLRGVIPLHATGRLRVGSIRLSGKSSSRETSEK